MSFVEVFNRLPQQQSPLVHRFRSLLEDDQDLEAMAREAAALTRQYFGRTMRLFAPLYVSNECLNICKYCGFSRDNPILRVTLSLDEVESEGRHLAEEGFRSVLIVAGEHPKFVSDDYLRDCIERLRKHFASIALEVGPMETEEYVPLVEAGAEGLVVYQETYDREIYTQMHTSGPKKNFDWRLECPERAYAAGFRRIGIGALIGLSDWKQEATRLAAHAEYLLKKCWKSSLTISLPRLKPAAGEFEPLITMSDREFVRTICALRICFPQVGLVLSTREPAALRDGLMPLGVTLISAGSHTEPGGYTKTGHDKLHRTEKGKPVPVVASEGEYATEQFSISDQRSATEIVEHLRKEGFDPVWKDWDEALAVKESS